MPTKRRAGRRGRSSIWVGVAVACFVALVLPTVAAAALCGDTSGDGFFRVSDALATLRLAVTGGYDRRGDVMPRPTVAVAVAGDGKVTAVDALESLRASVESRIPLCRGATASRIVASTAAVDFSSGGFAVIDIATRKIRYRAGAVSRDSVVRAPLGVPLVINRNGFNTVQLVDPEKMGSPTIKECSVSDGFDSNPQDLVLYSEQKGYVTAYAGPKLFAVSPPILFEPELDPACHGFITERIDLSAFDGDGIPQMSQMTVIGDELFVSLQVLDDNQILLPPKGPGVIAVIDTQTDTVTGSIPLSFENPFAETKGLVWDEFQELIFVGGPGNIAVLDDGGIEAVDPIARNSAGMRITGADIHANIFDFVIVGSARAYAVVADERSNSVVELAINSDPTKRGVPSVLLSSKALITDIEMTETGELWVAYRGESNEDPASLRVFDMRDNSEQTSKRISLSQAPYTFTFVP